MTAPSFSVRWLPAALEDPLERETLAQLQITADGVPLTEVYDKLAGTVRPDINVPAGLLARWLLMNWWRLRWEPFGKDEPAYEWCNSHSVASISSDYVWPPLTIASDGEFVRLRLGPSRSHEVSALRYLHTEATIDVAASDWERAVDRFVEYVRARLATRLPEYSELSELAEELAEERSSPKKAAACRLQALAGMAPGDASEEWLTEVKELVSELGEKAAEEIVAVLPSVDSLAVAKDTIAAMKTSSLQVNLQAANLASPDIAPKQELPWERGVRMARQLRAEMGIAEGPLSQKKLGEVLGVSLPLAPVGWHGKDPPPFNGGYRFHAAARILVTTSRETTQRFFLARLMAAQIATAASVRVLPISEAKTAAQKFQRAFAQEFLCPWQDLEAFIRHRGTSEEVIADAAEHFQVSELVIQHALTNRNRHPRQRPTSLL